MKRISVFCGSSAGNDPAYAGAAKLVGQALVRRGLGLVFGGGRVGLMGVVADAVLANGGEVIGVIPKQLATKELAHGGLSDLRVVESMHERKALMAELCDGFVALPGGFGTMEEFFEVLTWAQLGLHQKPCGVLNVKGYFDPLLALAEHAISAGFVSAEHRNLLLQDADIGALLDQFERYVPPPLPRWIRNLRSS
jgi:uncharacterized protein (TIGR00730 family)